MSYQSRSKMNKIVSAVHDKIKSNKEIIKLLHFNDASTDIYAQPDLGLKETLKVVEHQILTYRKEFTDNEACCYMILKYGSRTNHQERNWFFDGHTFNVYILCHNSIVVNEGVGDRVCEIESIIEELFDNVQLEGMACRCEIAGSEPIDSRNYDYSGRHIEIVLSDFNK